MEIRETKDCFELRDLFLRNGLEFTNNESKRDILKVWKLIHEEKIVGGCVLAKAGGEYVLDSIAIDPPYRGRGWSKLLLKKVFEYINAQKVKKLYLVAKAPEFFKKTGFKIISREQAPDFSGCFDCEQYQVSCFPEVMVKEWDYKQKRSQH